MNSTPMTARMAQPWRWLPTMRPNTLVSAAPIAKIEIICTKFDSAVGFSNGCAALALKKPPPLVPSILIAICEATGPDRDGLLGAFQRRRLDIGAERLRHALPDQEQRVDDADRQQDVERAAGDIDPEIADRSSPMRAQSRGSARPRARCRSPPTGSSGASGRASARDRTSCFRRRSSASWCW